MGREGARGHVGLVWGVHGFMSEQKLGLLSPCETSLAHDVPPFPNRFQQEARGVSRAAGDEPGTGQETRQTQRSGAGRRVGLRGEGLRECRPGEHVPSRARVVCERNGICWCRAGSGCQAARPGHEGAVPGPSAVRAGQGGRLGVPELFTAWGSAFLVATGRLPVYGK